MTSLGHNWPMFLTWINFNTGMDKYKVWDEITYLFLNFNGAAVEI